MRSPTDADTLLVPLKHVPGGLVPRLLARDLGRRPPGARGVHLPGRPEPWPGAAVPGAVDLGDGRDAEPRRGPLGRLHRRDDRDRPLRPADRDRAAARPARRRAPASARSSFAFGIAAGVALVAIPVYLLLATASFALRSCHRDRRPRAADPGLRIRPRLPRPRALLRAVRARGGGRALGRPARAGAALGRRAARDRRSARGRRRSARHPGRRRPRRADGAARAVAGARLGPPRGRLDLARRPDRPARALACAAGRAADAPALPSACRASRTSPSAR